MTDPGPDLEVLTHRLMETPADFVAEPRIGEFGTVRVGALVNDLLHMHGARAPGKLLQQFHGNNQKADRNRLALVMITVWLLADERFVAAKLQQADVARILGEPMRQLAEATPAHKFAHDPDRREELVRTVLAHLKLRPAGETTDQAVDRLSAISGIERRRLLEASRQAEQRARQIREALARKAAEESADKWSRE